MESISKWRLGFVLAIVCSVAILLVACGDSDDSTTGGSETSSDSAEIVPQPPTTPVNEFPIGDPLKKTPPAKQDVIWLACELPSCQGDLSRGYKDSAAALGFGFEQINYNPLKAAAAVQEALNKNPDTIFISGIDPAFFEEQAKEAIKKGIPIFNGFSTEEPDPKKNGVYMNYLSAFGYGLEGKQIASWITNDSGGKAKVLIVSVPEYPIVVAQVEAAEEQYGECPECSSDSLDVTVEDIGGGKVPAKVVAYLQENPDVDYLHFTFGDLVPGVEAAMESAGIGDQAKFAGVQSNPTIIQELVDGKLAAWTAQPQQFSGWFSMDGAVREAEGTPLTSYQLSGEVPTWVIDSAEEAQKLLDDGGEWAGPEGFQEQYEEQWGLK